LGQEINAPQEAGGLGKACAGTGSATEESNSAICSKFGREGKNRHSKEKMLFKTGSIAFSKASRYVDEGNSKGAGSGKVGALGSID